MVCTRSFDERRGSTVTEAEARAAMPCLPRRPYRLLERRAQLVGPRALAGDVVTDVKRERGPLLEGKASIEADDPIRLGRRD
jgi:hypothetical protein